MQKSNATSILVKVEKVGTAGIYPFDPQYVSIKRANPSPAKALPDFSLIEKKDKISEQVAQRKNRRSSTLSDSIRVDAEFESNPFSGLTPMDNHIAVSNDGIVISVINTNILISDSLGTTLLYRIMNSTFFNDGALTGTIYDPRVFYDTDNDRFILVVLHGSTSVTSRVLVCFSKSNRPDIDGWNYYKLNGNAFGNDLWFDYPNIGTNKNELFITGNLFTDAPRYSNKVIFQINKFDGYSGEPSVNTRIWGGITFSGGRLSNTDGNLPFTMVPAFQGFSNDEAKDMWFVSTNSGSGRKIYVYRITDEINNNPSIEISDVSVPFYTQSNFSSQFSGNSGAHRTLLVSGDSRMKNAYVQEGVIHCVWNARTTTGNFSSIMYARINTKNNGVRTKVFSEEGTDYTFSAAAPFSNNRSDSTALIVYTSVSSVKYPDIGVLTCDNDFNFSSPMTVKEGESYVDIYSSAVANRPGARQTRWGDYSGIAKRHNGSRPEVWIMGSYGAYSPDKSVPRHWKNWNAKIVSVDEKEISFNENRLYPNPVDMTSQTVTFNFVADVAGEYEIKVYDMNGKLVKDLYKDNLVSGEYRVTFSTDDFAIGSYILRYFVDGKSLGFEKLVVITK